MAEEVKQKTVVVSKKTPVYADKKTMNLAFHESAFNPKKMLPLILILVVAALAFVKVGFLDQNAKRIAALNEISLKQEQLSALQARLTGYQELSNQYGRYSYGWMTKEETSLVDRMDVLDMMENIVEPVCSIESMAVNSNVLNLTISGLSLESTSSLVDALEAHPLVRSVSVSAAKSEDEELNAKVTMIVILEKEDSIHG